MKHSFRPSQITKKVQKLRNVKQSNNPAKVSVEVLENRTPIMVNFAKQFNGINIRDKATSRHLKEYCRQNGLRKLYKGEFTPEVQEAIDKYVLPHFYRNAPQMMALLSRYGLDTWSRHIWLKYANASHKPLHSLMSNDRALCSFMHASLNLMQPDIALDIYTDHINNKLDKAAVTLALQSLGMMKRWDEMRHLFRVFNEKQPNDVDYIMIKILMSPLARAEKYDQVLSLLTAHIKELNDQTEIVLLSPLYNCKKEKDMRELLRWCSAIRKNLSGEKRDATIRMFNSASKRWPNLKSQFDEIIQQLHQHKYTGGGDSSSRQGARNQNKRSMGERKFTPQNPSHSKFKRPKENRTRVEQP